MRKGFAAATLSALFFGAGLVFVRFAYQAQVLPGTAVFLRFAIAAIVLILYLRLSGRWVNLPRRKVGAIFLLGFLGFSIMGITFFVAISLIPGWLVALITAMYPLLTNLGSWLFLRERMTGQHMLALASALTGCVFLFLQPFGEIVWAGVLLMILNISVSAAYLLIGQRWTRGAPPMMSAFWTIAGATCGTLLYSVFINELSLDFEPVGWLWVLCFAVLSTALSIMAQWWSIGLIGAARTSILGSFEPLSAVILAVLLLGERLTPLQLVGAVFILMGMFLVHWRPHWRLK